MAMNPSEARILLGTLLQPYREVGYRKLRRMVGHSEVVITSGPTGAEYRLECFVSRVDSREHTVSVSAIASEIGARRWRRSQIAVGFNVLSDGSIR
jgi:hypothetical protein